MESQFGFSCKTDKKEMKRSFKDFKIKVELTASGSETRFDSTRPTHQPRARCVGSPLPRRGRVEACEATVRISGREQRHGTVCVTTQSPVSRNFVREEADPGRWHGGQRSQRRNISFWNLLYLESSVLSSEAGGDRIQRNENEWVKIQNPWSCYESLCGYEYLYIFKVVSVVVMSLFVVTSIYTYLKLSLWLFWVSLWLRVFIHI